MARTFTARYDSKRPCPLCLAKLLRERLEDVLDSFEKGVDDGYTKAEELLAKLDDDEVLVGHILEGERGAYIEAHADCVWPDKVRPGQ